MATADLLHMEKCCYSNKRAMDSDSSNEEISIAIGTENNRTTGVSPPIAISQHRRYLTGGTRSMSRSPSPTYSSRSLSPGISHARMNPGNGLKGLLSPPRSPRIPRDPIQPSQGSISDLSRHSNEDCDDDEESEELDSFNCLPTTRPRSSTCPENRAWKRRVKVKLNNRPPTPPPCHTPRTLSPTPGSVGRLSTSDICLPRVVEDS